MEEGLHVGLGTDMAGGASLSMLRVMTDAVQVSKMYWRYLDKEKKPLSAPEAFYLGTKGGGSFSDRLEVSRRDMSLTLSS